MWETLERKIIPQASGNDAEALANAGNDQTIMELAVSFHGGDEVDAVTLEAMAKALKETMRKSPVDDKVKC